MSRMYVSLGQVERVDLIVERRVVAVVRCGADGRDSLILFE